MNEASVRKLQQTTTADNFSQDNFGR